MLSKSLKHEFRATARVMLPVFLALLAVSAVTSLTNHFFLSGDSVHWVFRSLGVCMMILFFLGIAAVAFSVFALTIVRFYRSFLSEQGYLTMSLPVGTHTHIFSRLLVAVVWYTLSAIAIVAAICVLTLGINGYSGFAVIGDVLRGLWQAWTSLTGGQRGLALLLVFEMLASVVASCAASCLLLYAAMAVGHSFNRHKKALSVVFAFVFYHVVQILLLIGAFAVAQSSFNLDHYFDSLNVQNATAVIGVMNVFFAVILAVQAALCLVFYFITHYFLTKKLNLE